jgi:uncharacterized phage-like protein YoqJ
MRIVVTGHRPDKLRSVTYTKQVPRKPQQSGLLIDGVPMTDEPRPLTVETAHDGYDRNNPVRTHLRQRLRTLLVALAADAWLKGDKQVELISGGALGWDQDCAGVAYRVGIPYVLYVPFVGQDSKWPQQSRDVYAEVEKRASKIVLCHPDRPLSDGHAGRLLLERNKRMIDDAPTDYLIAAWNGEAGGTSHCVRYATPKVGRVINLLGCDARGQRIEPDCRNQYEMERQRAVKDGVVCV